MSKISEAETLKNQIKYLTDLINNANKRKQANTIQKTVSKASTEVRCNQQRTGAHPHTKTELQRFSKGNCQQPQCQKYASGHQIETQKSLKQGKYVWTNSATSKPKLVTPEQPRKLIKSGKNQGLSERASTVVAGPAPKSPCTSSRVVVRGNNQSALENSSAIRGTINSDRTISDVASLHFQTGKYVPSATATSKQISYNRNKSSKIVHVPAPPSSLSAPSTSNVSSSSVKDQLDKQLKGTSSSVALSVKSASNLQSNPSTHSPATSSKGRTPSLPSSTHTKHSSNDIPPLVKSQRSNDSCQKPVSQVPSTVSKKKSCDDNNVILLTVNSKLPDPVEQDTKRETSQTSEKLSVIPSFLRNRLSKKMSKEVDTPLTSTHAIPPKVGPESKKEKSTASLNSSDSENCQPSRVPFSGQCTVLSEKETILPQNKHYGAKSSCEPSKELVSQDTALSSGKTTSVCHDNQQLNSSIVSHSPGRCGPIAASSSQSLDAGGMKQPDSLTRSLMAAESMKFQSSSIEQICPSKEPTSPVSKIGRSDPSTASSPSSPFKSGKHLLGSSMSFTNTENKVNMLGSKSGSLKTGQVSFHSPTSSPQKLSQAFPVTNTSSPNKTCNIEKQDSRKDTVLQLSEKLAKTQAEIKRMTRNITNSQVTMKSIAAIKKEKSQSVTQSHHSKVKSLHGAKNHKPHKMYGQDPSNGPKLPIKKGHTFPARLNTSKCNSQFQRSSKSHVVFDKKYSLNKKLTAPCENPGDKSSQTSRSALTPSKTQVVAKVIKSKYKLWKVASTGVKTPPPHYDGRPLNFPKKTYLNRRGNSFPSNYSYHGHWGRGQHWGNQYEHSSYPTVGLRKHYTYPGTRGRSGHYRKHLVPKGLYPVTNRGPYHLSTPQKVKRSQLLRSKVIFDKKYVLKRLQHDKSSRSSFKLDKRRQPLSVPPAACGTSLDLKGRLTSTVQPTGTPGKSSFVVINGMLYKSSSKSLVRTSPVKMSPEKSTTNNMAANARNSNIVVKKMQSKSMKVVTVRGVQFQMDASGKTLRRVNSASSTQGDSQQSQTTVKRLDIGGVTFVRNSQGALERIGSANTRVVANRVIHKSIAAATARYRKSSTRNKLSKQYCLFFNRFGKCKRGDKCPYIHDPDKVAVCTRFLRGTCQMTGCPFSHKVTKEKMPVCSYFLRGICNRDECPYLHVKVNKNASICQNFVKGFCPLGEKCKKQHTLECPVFSRTGQCPAGRTCPLIHKSKKEKPRKKRSVASTVGEPLKTLDEPTLKRTATHSGITEMDDNTSGIPFKSQKLPTFISLGTSKETETQTQEENPIRIKPKL